MKKKSSHCLWISIIAIICAGCWVYLILHGFTPNGVPISVSNSVPINISNAEADTQQRAIDMILLFMALMIAFLTSMYLIDLLREYIHKRKKGS